MLTTLYRDMLSATCAPHNIFVRFHFISCRFVSENMIPLGGETISIPSLSLVTADMHFFFPQVSQRPSPELSFLISHTLNACLLAHVNSHLI